MSTINPYEVPAEPPPPQLPGKKYRVDPRRLALTEAIQIRQSVWRGAWDWLCWQLGLRGDPTYIQSVPSAPEMTAELADMPAGVGEYLLQFHSDALKLGFSGRWTSMTVDEMANPTCCLLRMLGSDPRLYLEVAFVIVGTRYISRHNLVSATIDGEYWVTSNGFPMGRRAPVVKPVYWKDVPLDQLLPRHLAWLNSQPNRFREIRSIEHVNVIVQELMDSYARFQITRGYFTPLDSK
jgi:hypothetical protein